MDARMRVRHIIERYRDFAARTHLAMTIIAAGLVVAIIVLMIISAMPSHAGFLAAEAKNIVTMAPTSDMLLVLTVALVFLAVLIVKLLDRQTPAE
jgi:hypothetical protein